MKLNVYKSKYGIFEELNNKILQINKDNEFEYEKMGQIKENNEEVQLTLYLEKHPRNNPAWYSEIGTLFQHDIENENGYILNGLVVVQTKSAIYILSFGNAYHKVKDLSDIEFGLDFAERSMEPKSVDVKSVSYALSNKRKEITNFKENQNELPKANESYSNISGTPTAENIYGKNIECGISVKISKDISITNHSVGENIYTIFNQIDTTMKLNPKASIPRFKKIHKKDDFSKVLFSEVLNIIKNNKESELVDIGFNQIINNGSKEYVLDNTSLIECYVNNYFRNRKSVQISSEDLLENIKSYIVDYNLNDINNIKFKITDYDSGESFTKNFSEFVHCEMEYEEQIYVLDDGNWRHYNQAFLNLLDENLDYINSEVMYDKQFSIEYPIDDLTGEDAYIDKLRSNKDITKLHKKFIKVNKTQVELADVFSTKNNELYAIKRGMETKDITHSFNQAGLAMNALNNKNEFGVKDYLKNNIDDSNIRNQIEKCKNYSVLWLIKEKPDYMWKMVENKNLDLKKIKSAFVKLAINDWYQRSKDANFSSKLYFVLDKPFLHE